MNKKRGYTMFLIIVVAVNLMVNLYLFFRTRPLFPDSTLGWWLSAAFFWLLAFSYIIGRFIERTGLVRVAEPFIAAGSWWLGAMVYLTLLFLLIDLLRGLNGLVHVTDVLKFNWVSSRGMYVALVVYAMTAAILAVGYFNARIPVVRQVRVQLNKPVPGGLKKIVLVSDIHLGMTITNGKLSRMVNLVNSQNADLVLLAGDIFDEDLGPVIKNNMGDLLKDLNASHGVYAILGNHEFYGNAAAAQQYLEEHNITVLRDSVAILPGGVSIAGRQDLTYERMNGKSRKTLENLLSDTDKKLPVIVMDHQPANLEEAVRNQVDLQVSGHTHNGQMWPFNYITGAVYDISKGYGQIKNTHFYVSSGYGTWGPPIRTNSRSEIVVLELVSLNQQREKIR